MSELMTLGEYADKQDRMLELRRLIWREDSWEKIYPLAQELADLTSVYTVKEKSDAD